MCVEARYLAHRCGTLTTDWPSNGVGAANNSTSCHGPAVPDAIHQTEMLRIMGLIDVDVTFVGSCLGS